MSGYELLVSKMKELGATRQQAESKTVEMVVTILAGDFETADSRMAVLKDLEDEYRKKARECEAAEGEYRNERYNLRQKLKDLSRVRSIFADMMSEMKDMYNELTEAETPAARDRIRTARIYETKVNINTCYDNTAFIRGLSTILSGQPLPDEDTSDNPDNSTGKERKKLHYNEVSETISRKLDEKLAEAEEILSEFNDTFYLS